ncbi:MAG TPA: hypothetical protein VLA19_21945, partial [Herpetosiphonaceae bacterium]|nr:hypothetical protein [Herpetosiphonaceae bacterium]
VATNDERPLTTDNGRRALVDHSSAVASVICRSYYYRKRGSITVLARIVRGKRVVRGWIEGPRRQV